MKRRTHTYLLKDCTLNDSVMAFLYGLSAQTNGDFDKVELKIDDDKPYIKVSKHKAHEEFHEVIEAWNYLMEKFESATEKLIELAPKIQTIVEEAPSYGDKAKEALSSAGDLNPFQVARATKAIISNVATLTKVPTVLNETKKLLEDLGKTFKSLGKLLDHECRERIHAIGKEIHKAKVFNMREIVVQYWPDKIRVEIKNERPRKSKPAPKH